MKVPIPQDWDGQTWRCVRIEWPDSLEYRAILGGLLSYLMRGRYWDEQTGSVQDAQGIGWQIWDRNEPLIDCEGNPVPILNGTGSISTGGGITLLEDEDMGQVVTEIKIVDGKLRVYYGHCCYDELDISSAIVAQAQELSDDPLNTENDPNFVYSACGKAKAIVDIVFNIVAAAWDELDTLPAFWQVIPNIERAVGYDLDNGALIKLMGNVAATDALGYTASDFQDANDKQRILCQLVSRFADTSAGIPDSGEYEAVKAVFINEVLSLWEPTASGMFEWALDALGRVDMDAVAKLGAGDTSAQCDCPEAEWPEIPTLYDWVHVYDFRTGLHGWEDVQTMWVSGYGFYNPDVDWAERLGDVSKAPIATGGHVTFMAMKVAVWPTNPGNGGVDPHWFQVDTDGYYDAAWIGSNQFITWSPASPPLIDGLIRAGAYQFDQTSPDPTGVSQWYKLLIAGTGTDPFAGDP